MSRIARLATALALLCTVAVAVAAPSPPREVPPTRLDPSIFRALDTGVVGAWQRGAPTPGPARVVVELRGPATPSTLAALTAAGARLTLVQGRPLFYERFVPAIVASRAAAVAIAALDEVARLSLAPLRGPLPLDRSAELVRLADARGARPALDRLTGKGILIGDVDTIVDIFHPTFFHGDGGYHDWIDTNGDGRFTPGQDALDLDRDGKASPGETARLLAATTVDFWGRKVNARPDGFDPGLDWLYLDTNGNGRRDHGAAAGFTDATPALGEPLFVPDDVNRNGKLDPGERVVRLGTSKVRKIYVASSMVSLEIFERGLNLAETRVNYTDGMAYGFPDALHGTGVNTILVGDVPLVGRRWVGMAPEAEVIVVWDISDYWPTTGVAWALAEKPQVMLYELAPWTGVPLDGSDVLSQMIDTSTTVDHVTNTCPTGDQGSARKHARAIVAPTATASLAFDLPPHAKLGMLPLTYIALSINVRGGAPTDVVLTTPTGEQRHLLTAPQGTLASGARYYATTQQSPRATAFTDVVLYAYNGKEPDVGAWTLAVTADAQSTLTVDAYLSDDQSSWAVGAAWDASIASDLATIGVPSVADHCIAVNAVPDHLDDGGSPWFDVYYGVYDLPLGWKDAVGRIRAYNPRGPRLDGVIKPDLCAPDNPWVAAEHDEHSLGPPASFSVFGGTSGASPHVTGVAALLAQVGVHGDEARDVLRATAVSDGTTGLVPNGDYGYGRLDAAAALGQKTLGEDFAITLTATPARPTSTDTVELVVAVTGPAAVAGLEVRWDDGYDGSWDTDYSATLTRTFPSRADGVYPIKVRARSSSGRIAEAPARITVETPPPTPLPLRSGCGCHLGTTGAVPAGSLSLWLLLAALSAGAYRLRHRR